MSTSMTMTQKILAAHANLEHVTPDQLIMANVDMVLGNDITSPMAIDEFRKHGFVDVFDKNKIAIVLDHFVPNKDIKSAEQCKVCRSFARETGIKNLIDGEGIEHVLLPERGLCVAGDVVVGADSHTCTYGGLGAFATGFGSTDMAFAMAKGQAWFKVPHAIKIELKGHLNQYVTGKDLILYIIGKIGVDGALYKSMEFVGGNDLSMSDRFCICNMAIEAGAKNGIFEVDEKTIEFMKSADVSQFKIFRGDADAYYEQVIEIELDKIEPMVSCPHSPDNTRKISEFSGIPINQVVIGSCTNGRLEDLVAAANILQNKRVAKEVRTIIIPGSQKIYLEALKLGLITIFIESGCIVSPPTCGPCLGGHMGVLASGERAVSTTNRNFVGRMGHIDSEVYLASPITAAYSAINGEISSPTERNM